MNSKNYSKAITERIFAVILQGSFIFYLFACMVVSFVATILLRFGENSKPAPGWYTAKEYRDAENASVGIQYIIVSFLFFFIIYFCGGAFPLYGTLALLILIVWFLVVLFYFLKVIPRYGIKHAFELFLLRIVLLKKNLEQGIGKYRGLNGSLLKKCVLAFIIGAFFVWFWELNPLKLCDRYVVPLRFLYPVWNDAIQIVGWGGLVGWVLFLAIV